MSFHQTAAVHRCACGCGAIVSRKGLMTNACRARTVAERRTPEERHRIAQTAADGRKVQAARARALPPQAWSSTSRFL